MLSNEDARRLCLSLMEANTEEEIINLIREPGFWDDSRCWRFYGDEEGNFSTVGNQQSKPEAALVEKVVNSVDARLMNGCLVRGSRTDEEGVPTSIQEAVAEYFEDEGNGGSIRAGRITNWPDTMRTKIARGITLAATGAKPSDGNPCFTISDSGEGQTPEMIPSTILSIGKNNKLRVPFVQGKFNMGGTGSLQFCGQNNLQLVVSRRNPMILQVLGESHSSDSQWGFTLVRRENPGGGRRNSVYTYLAPIGCDSRPGQGGVLRFFADEMPIFPDGRSPYQRTSEWGTLIKLYEYKVPGHKGHMFMRDGMLRRLDILLADIALPVRLHECRYPGHKGSPETTLTGISVRLDDDKAENLEFSTSCSLLAFGQRMIGTIYAFKRGKADTYKKNEGVIFTINGQTHGALVRNFFRRNKVGLSNIHDSILVSLDCSQIDGRAREDLFMNSRDRIRQGEHKLEIEKALEDLLKNHSGLRALKESRRSEDLQSRLDESKPLVDILQDLIKSSPTLSNLFLSGSRLSNPRKPRDVGTGEEFNGEVHPTYFRFKNKEYGTVLERGCHINMRARIAFDTDVVNDYFHRDENRGTFDLLYESNGRNMVVENYSLNLQNGIANLSVQIPAGSIEGDQIRFVSKVTDDTLIDPLENIFILELKPAIEPSREGGERRRPPNDAEGTGRTLPTGLQLPNITRIYESDWGNHDFDKYSALKIVNVGSENDKKSRIILDCRLHLQIIVHK